MGVRPVKSPQDEAQSQIAGKIRPLAGEDHLITSPTRTNGPFCGSLSRPMEPAPLRYQWKAR